MSTVNEVLSQASLQLGDKNHMETPRQILTNYTENGPIWHDLQVWGLESEVIAEGSVYRVLNGQQYNQGIRLHKLVFEAPQRLAWKGFISWFQRNQATPEELKSLLDDTNQRLSTLVSQAPRKILMWFFTVHILSVWLTSFKSMFHSWDLMQDLWHTFGCCTLTWSRFFIWLDLQEKETGHFICIPSMLFFHGVLHTTDTITVVTSVFTMQKWPDSQVNPDVYEQIMNGEFSVQNSGQNPFGRIPVDQTTEEPVNKDTNCRINQRIRPQASRTEPLLYHSRV